MSLKVIERRRTVATVVFRPIDALRVALGRPFSERGPVRPVRFRIAGRVNGVVVEPIGEWTPESKPYVMNASGDTVYRDFALPPGTYRIEIVRDPHQDSEGIYADLLPGLERDLNWDPAAPLTGLPNLPSHPTRLEERRLRPGPRYPFPPGSTLVRGQLLWYDGTGMTGAVARAPAAVVPETPVGSRGEFVLIVAPAAPAGNLNVALDLGAVDPAAKPGGGMYVATWPSNWSIGWTRGRSSGARQGALTGTVRRADGRALQGARITLGGEPGELLTDAEGRWSYHFPPLRPAGTVNVTVQHPDFASKTVPNVAFPAEATRTLPPIVLP
jgi:hypothetical protein